MQYLKSLFRRSFVYIVIFVLSFTTIQLVRKNYVFKIMDKDAYMDSEVCKGQLSAAEYQLADFRELRDKENSEVNN